MIDLPPLDIQEKQAQAFEMGLNPSTLLPALTQEWVQPNSQDIRIVIKLAKCTGSQIAKLIDVDSRTIRKWVSEERKIPFAAWAVLVDLAGLGQIWKGKPIFGE